jgi:hypothetical protein
MVSHDLNLLLRVATESVTMIPKVSLYMIERYCKFSCDNVVKLAVVTGNGNAVMVITA